MDYRLSDQYASATETPELDDMVYDLGLENEEHARAMAKIARRPGEHQS
jgi:hypothetical protein